MSLCLIWVGWNTFTNKRNALTAREYLDYFITTMEKDDKAQEKLQRAASKPRKSIAGKKGAGASRRPDRRAPDGTDSERASKPGNVITGINFANSASNAEGLNNAELLASRRSAEVRGDVEMRDGTFAVEMPDLFENSANPEYVVAPHAAEGACAANDTTTKSNEAAAESTPDDKQNVSGNTARPTVASKKKLPVIIVTSVFVALVLTLAISLSYFAHATWYAHDDKQDIIGSWTSAQGVPVEISADKMALSVDLVYEYSLDVSDKHISYNVKEIQGSGLYFFSKDRLTLSIQDGENFSFFNEFLYFYNLKQRPVNPDAPISVFTRAK